jgi:hypothetical protein
MRYRERHHARVCPDCNRLVRLKDFACEQSIFSVYIGRCYIDVSTRYIPPAGLNHELPVQIRSALPKDRPGTRAHSHSENSQNGQDPLWSALNDSRGAPQKQHAHSLGVNLHSRWNKVYMTTARRFTCCLMVRCHSLKACTMNRRTLSVHITLVLSSSPPALSLDQLPVSIIPLIPVTTKSA